MKFMSILISEGRKEDLKKKYSNKFDEETLNWILNISDLVDFNHKYTDFLLRVVDPKIDATADYVDIIIDNLKLFDKYQSKLEKKDINQYKDVIELENSLKPFQEKEKEKELESQSKKIYEKGDFVVIQPKTEEASCKYGSNTKWCVTSKGSGHFGRYTAGRQGLYFIINKAKSTNKNYSKVAIHFDDGGNIRYWDAQDSPMSQREIDVFEYAFPEMIEAIKSDYKVYVGSMTDKFLTESFNSVGETSADKRNYLNSTYTLSTLVRGFQNIPDLGFGHTEGVLTISLSSDEDNKLIDEYNIFITYKSKDEKTFTASIGFGSTDEVSSDDFVDLGLEGWGIDATYYLGKTPAETAEGVRRHIAHRVLDHIVNNQKLIQMVAGTTKVFRPTYGYKFGKNKGWVKKLVDYLDKGKIGTKLDFLMDIGYIEPVIKDGQKGYKKSKGNHFYKPRDLRGQHSSFFAAAKNAGILGYRKVGKDFFLIKGPNFDAFKKGELKAL